VCCVLKAINCIIRQTASCIYNLARFYGGCAAQIFARLKLPHKKKLTQLVFFYVEAKTGELSFSSKFSLKARMGQQKKDGCAGSLTLFVTRTERVFSFVAIRERPHDNH